MRKYVYPLPQPLQVICSFACHKARRPPSLLPGTDYPKKTGTKIKAITSGVVVVADRTDNSDMGKNVQILHGRTVRSYYLHMDSVSVKVGDRVAAGDVIGTVGATGSATGPHLHLSIRVLGALVDPHKWLARRVA